MLVSIFKGIAQLNALYSLNNYDNAIFAGKVRSQQAGNNRAVLMFRSY